MTAPVTDAGGDPRARSIRVVTAAVVLAFAVVGVVFATRFHADPRLVRSSRLGHPAPTRALPLLDDAGTRSLADLRGSIVVVNFWASWCVPCRAEHAVLRAAAESYADDGVRFVGILHEDSRPEARAFLDELGRSYPALVDPGSRAAIDFGVRGVPETFFLDRRGVIVGNVVGPVDADLLSRTLDAMLLGRSPGSTRTGDVETRPTG